MLVKGATDDKVRHSLYMMTSSNGNIFRVTGPLCGEFTGLGEFPTQRPVMRSFDVYFDLCLNKRLCKQSWGWWFEMLLCPLWGHSNEAKVHLMIFYRAGQHQICSHSAKPNTHQYWPIVCWAIIFIFAWSVFGNVIPPQLHSIHQSTTIEEWLSKNGLFCINIFLTEPLNHTR